MEEREAQESPKKKCMIARKPEGGWFSYVMWMMTDIVFVLLTALILTMLYLAVAGFINHYIALEGEFKSLADFTERFDEFPVVFSVIFLLILLCIAIYFRVHDRSARNILRCSATFFIGVFLGYVLAVLKEAFDFFLGSPILAFMTTVYFGLLCLSMAFYVSSSKSFSAKEAMVAAGYEIALVSLLLSLFLGLIGLAPGEDIVDKVRWLLL